MPSFVCDACQETLKKAKLDQHAQRCKYASFSCIDCSTSFKTAQEYRQHTSCVSEAQKYQKSLYNEKKKQPLNNNHNDTVHKKRKGLDEEVKKIKVDYLSQIREIINESPMKRMSLKSCMSLMKKRNEKKKDYLKEIQIAMQGDLIVLSNE